MMRVFLGLGLAAAVGAGCVAPNWTNFREAPTDRELAAMVHRRAAFTESPYGPYGAPTHAEVKRTIAAGMSARQDRDDVVFWMEVDDPAWTGRPHARVPGQAQWLTAIEAKVIGTQQWERGGAIVQHLRMDWMRDAERRATITRNLQEMDRRRRFAFAGYAIAGVPPADSDAAYDGRPGLTVHERHVWRINWGWGHHWWMRDDRPPVVLNFDVVPVPQSHEGDSKGTAMPPKAGDAKPGDAKPGDAKKAQPKKAEPKKPASKKDEPKKAGSSGEFF